MSLYRPLQVYWVLFCVNCTKVTSPYHDDNTLHISTKLKKNDTLIVSYLFRIALAQYYLLWIPQDPQRRQYHFVVTQYLDEKIYFRAVLKKPSKFQFTPWFLLSTCYLRCSFKFQILCLFWQFAKFASNLWPFPLGKLFDISGKTFFSVEDKGPLFST